MIWVENARVVVTAGPPADLGTPVTTNSETCRCTQPRLPCRSARSETFRLHVLDTQQSTQRRAASLETAEAATDPRGRTGRCRIGAQATGLVVWVALRPAESQTRRSEPPFRPVHMALATVVSWKQACLVVEVGAETGWKKN